MVEDESEGHAREGLKYEHHVTSAATPEDDNKGNESSLELVSVNVTDDEAAVEV